MLKPCFNSLSSRSLCQTLTFFRAGQILKKSLFSLLVGSLQINEAYSVLSDKVKKFDYDRTLRKDDRTATRTTTTTSRHTSSSTRSEQRTSSTPRARARRSRPEEEAARRQQQQEYESWYARTGATGQSHYSRPPPPPPREDEERWNFTWQVIVILTKMNWHLALSEFLELAALLGRNEYMNTLGSIPESHDVPNSLLFLSCL